MPKAAIVILAYNARQYVAAAIESALMQTVSDIEVIVQDDCSADGTWDIVRSFRDPRLSVFRNERNLGHIHNANTAIARTSAPLVVKLDPDDYLLHRYVARCLPVFDDPRVGMVYTECLRSSRGSWNLYCRRAADTVCSGRSFILQTLERGNPCLHSTVMFRRGAFEAAGRYSDTLCARPLYEDLSLWLRLACIGGVAYIGEPLGCIVNRPGSATKLFDDPRMRSSLRYQVEEVSGICESAFRAGVLQPADRAIVSRLLLRQWLRSADGCAFSPEHSAYCLGKAVSESMAASLASRHFWRLAVKRLLGCHAVEKWRSLAAS